MIKFENNVVAYKVTGNSDYKEKAIIEHAKLVKIIASQIYTKNVNAALDLEDYEQFGIFGLIDAIEKYDVSKKDEVKFETFASYRIRGAILDEVRKLDISRTIRKKQKTYNAIVTETIKKIGYHYTRNNLITTSGLTEEEFRDIENSMSIHTARSFEEVIGVDDDGLYNYNIADPNKLGDGEKEALKQDLANTLKRALSCLTEKEKIVTTLIYYEDLSLKEIAKILEISTSRVSQLHTKALNKMKLYLQKEEDY